MHTRCNAGRWRFAAVIAVTLVVASARLAAQHQHAMADSTKKGVSMNGVLGISMERMGSGTTWIPDAVVLPSAHFTAGSWMLMLHGFAFGVYDWQDGPRGGDQFSSLNWGMFMADRAVRGGGHVQFRFMPSLEPATSMCGYRLLFQSGETCDGQPLVDRQHPHDLFKELAVLYEQPLSGSLAALLYAAPAGEPALGPVAFIHRPSAMDNPQAPLGHHWQDATHISFGVATAGIFTRHVRLEASTFNAVEPDEERWNLDVRPLRSFSGRLTVSPNPNWTLTAGYGRLDNPEQTNPPESVTRFVASAMYGRGIGTAGQWATTAIYGSNGHEGMHTSHSGLLESEAVFDDWNTLFGRVEWTQKSAHDLQLLSFPHDQLFDVGAATLGFVRELVRGHGATIGLGVLGTVNLAPAVLEPLYGSRTPLGAMAFLRLRPYLNRPSGAQPAHEHE